MYSVFRKNRGLKLLTLAIVALIAWFLLTPAISLIEGREADETSLIGSYASGREHQVVIYPESLGRMVSSGHSEDFRFSYSEGTLSCNGEESSWTMKVLEGGNLYNCYDGTYLYKRI